MKAYISCLSTDNYLMGILVLNKSLENTGTKYPHYCMVASSVSKSTIDSLERNNVKVIIKDPINVEEYTHKAMTGWYYTYFKLRIFELTQFEKLVFLDADMIVLQNLDELFDYEPIAACADGYQFTGIKDATNTGCNSGLMVIKPDVNLYNQMLQKLPEYIAEGKSGDQGIVNYFISGDNWLPEIYNMTPNMIDKACYREKYYKFKYKDIKVVHFIWKFKPFFATKLSIKKTVDLIIRTHFYEIKVLRTYYKVMASIS